jgi:crotonobetainyl-CoA:carnitine CoA-transferase CaiB-like acyl-CoA transferase
MPLPLAGLRVVELSTTMTGANIGMFLADFGAEVLQVEPPGGSPLRSNPGFPVWARGKRSVELDLTTAEGRRVAQSVASVSDIVIETWRPGVSERLGLGYDDLAAGNPRLIYTSVTGFGRQGPFRDLKGYEGLVMAKLGLFSAFHTGVLREGPGFTAVPFASWSASQTALHGTLAALYAREQSGLGQRVDTSLVQGVLAHDIWNWYLHIVRERYPDAFTAAPVFDDDGVPTGPLTVMVLVALTADGRWLQFSQIRPHLFRAFIKALGYEWMYDDPKWSTLPAFDDAEKRSEFWNLLLEGVRQKTRAQWQEIFDADPDVWAETYRHGAELLSHPQFVHIGGPVEIHDPHRGVVRQPGRLVTLHDASPALTRSAPALDEQGRLVRQQHQGRAATSPMTQHEPPPPQATPLEGVTVLELGTIYAGPYGATLLADLGARVIKVEPLDGDPIRSMQPFPEVGGMKVLQGKESIALDLGTEEGRKIVHQLAARCAIVVQSWRAGVADRLGVDSASLQAVNPELIYLNAPGYGIDGPYAAKPSFAPTIGAAAGLGSRSVGSSFPESPDLSMQEVRERSRQLLGFNNNVYCQSDGCSALANATALLLGLVARARTGQVHTMTTTMLMSVAHALSDQVVEYAGQPELATVDPDILGLSPCYRLYRAADDWIFLAAPAEHEWDALAKALDGRAELQTDERFNSPERRARNAEALAAVLEKCFATRPAAEWEQDLTAVDVGCAVVAPEPVEKVIQSDEFGRASGFVTDSIHPMFDEHPRLAPLVFMSRSTGALRPGCLAGQHTDAILAELGYTESDVAALRSAGVVT